MKFDGVSWTPGHCWVAFDNFLMKFGWTLKAGAGYRWIGRIRLIARNVALIIKWTPLRQDGTADINALPLFQQQIIGVCNYSDITCIEWYVGANKVFFILYIPCQPMLSFPNRQQKWRSKEFLELQGIAGWRLTPMKSSGGTFGWAAWKYWDLLICVLVPGGHLVKVSLSYCVA